MAAEQVTYFEDCDRTLLVLLYDHLLTDVNGMQTVVNRWMELTAAICSDKPLPERQAVTTTNRLAIFARPSPQLQIAGSNSSSATAALQHWLPTEVAEPGAAATAPGSSWTSSSSVAEACKQWLADHPPTFVSAPLNADVCCCCHLCHSSSSQTAAPIAFRMPIRLLTA